MMLQFLIVTRRDDTPFPSDLVRIAPCDDVPLLVCVLRGRRGDRPSGLAIVWVVVLVRRAAFVLFGIAWPVHSVSSMTI